MKELVEDTKVDEPEVEPVVEKPVVGMESAPAEPEAETISENVEDEVCFAWVFDRSLDLSVL